VSDLLELSRTKFSCSRFSRMVMEKICSALAGTTELEQQVRLIQDIVGREIPYARDAESQGVAPVLNPNRFSESRMAEATKQTLEGDRSAVDAWSRWVRDRGPAYAVRGLEQLLGKGAPEDPSNRPDSGG
jgi:hypothetical protein